LSGFVQRAGFVTLGMASGPNAWLTGNGGTGRTGDSSGGGGGGGPVPVRAPIDPASTTTSSFPSTGGRSLGGEKRGLLSRGTKPPKTAEERAAVLQRAAERRRQQQAQEDGDPGV